VGRRREQKLIGVGGLWLLNPDIVVPAHGRPMTVQLLEETETF
jgi:hypothetical protein